MAAVGAPVDLGVAVGPDPVRPAPAPAPPRLLPGAAPGVPFTDDIMRAVNAGVDESGYELSYGVYIARLEPSLRDEYDEPRGRRDPPPVVPPAGPAPGADPVGIELARIKNYLNEAGRNRKPAGWDNGRMNGAVNRARDSPDVVALGEAIPFDVNAYRVAILANLNANAPPGFNYRGVGP